jgi:hypothetical protein
MINWGSHRVLPSVGLLGVAKWGAIGAGIQRLFFWMPWKVTAVRKTQPSGGSGICRARRARVSAVQDVVNDKRELGQGIGGGIGGKLAERPQVPFTA